MGTAVRLYVLPLPNVALARDVFRLTSRDVAMARRTLRRRGLVPCGCFHTHPTRGPEPSSLDRSSMANVPRWWLIYSPLGHRLRMIRARGGRTERARVRVR